MVLEERDAGASQLRLGLGLAEVEDALELLRSSRRGLVGSGAIPTGISEMVLDMDIFPI